MACTLVNEVFLLNFNSSSFQFCTASILCLIFDRFLKLQSCHNFLIGDRCSKAHPMQDNIVFITVVLCSQDKFGNKTASNGSLGIGFLL